MPASTTSAPLSLAELDHLREVVAQRRDGLAAQAVVAAELDDDERRIVRCEQARQAREPAGRRVARDAGIHYLITVTFRLQAILEHRDPGLLRGYPIAAAQGVAHHDDGLPGAARCRKAENGQREQDDQAFEDEHRRVPVTSRESDEKG